MINWPILAAVVAIAAVSLLAFHRKLHSGRRLPPREAQAHEAALREATAGTPVMVGGMVRARLYECGVGEDGMVTLILHGRVTTMPVHTVTLA